MLRSASPIVAGLVLALTATTVLADGHLPPEAAENGLSIAFRKSDARVPAADLADLVRGAGGGRDRSGGAEEGGAGSGVDVPDDFGQLVSEFAQGNASSAEPGAVADYVHDQLRIDPRAFPADIGHVDGGPPVRIPAGEPDLTELPEVAPDLSGVPAGAGPPADAGRP